MSGVSALVSWASHNISTVAALIAIVAGLYSIGASYYSMKTKRAEERRSRAMDEHLCSICDGTGTNCPYPVAERPQNCKLRTKGTA